MGGRELNLSMMREIVAMCSYVGYEFAVLVDGRGAIYLQASYMEPDVTSGNEIPVQQLTRRCFLSPMMTRSEIVQTVFKCVLTSMEHRVREWFRYSGQPIEEKKFSARES
jgi:hypothetical protein